MRNDNAGCVQLRQVCHDLRLPAVVEPVGGFVQQQNPGLAQQRASDHDALRLAARQYLISDPHRSRRLHWHPLDVPLDGRQFSGAPHFIFPYRFVMADDIVPDIIGMKVDILGNDTHLAAYLLAVQVLEVPAIVVHRSGVWFGLAQGQPKECALARS